MTGTVRAGPAAGLLLAVMPLACAPGGDAGKAEALDEAERLGAQVVADSSRPGSPVTELWCGNTRADNGTLAHFRGLRGLRVLYLSRTLVTDPGLAHLEPLTSLEVLSLRETSVTDAGLKHLRALRGLRELDLEGTRVTDSGLTVLKELPALRKLYLERTRVTEAGVTDLKKSLPELTVSR